MKPMAERQYQIIFDATVTGEYNLNTTRRRFEKVFGLDKPALEKLFSGKEILIKKNLSEGDALQFATKIADTGCECVIECMLEEGEENFKENRELGERRMRFRRHARPTAFVPDRRLDIRRSNDSEYFQELILGGADIPVGYSSYSTVTKKKA